MVLKRQVQQRQCLQVVKHTPFAPIMTMALFFISVAIGMRHTKNASEIGSDETGRNFQISVSLKQIVEASLLFSQICYDTSVDDMVGKDTKNYIQSLYLRKLSGGGELIVRSFLLESLKETNLHHFPPLTIHMPEGHTDDGT